MVERGWETLDFIFVSGDAYVDHPSFGPALLCRLLEAHGYRVGIIAQPQLARDADFQKLGTPRLGFLVSSGNLDSVLSKYTAAKRLRHQDAYSPGGRAGLRPARAAILYVQKLRQLFPHVPIIVGGIEASLRRLVHYDYWQDQVRISLLEESGADLLIYGMGELQLLRVAADLHAGVAIENIQDIEGTCYRVPASSYAWDYLELPSYQEILQSKEAFTEAFRLTYWEQDPIRGKRLLQKQKHSYVVQNPPMRPLTTAEMDEIYELPYTRRAHPIYDKYGGVPALQEVQFGLVSQRGCFGGCNFCAIVSHQGRIIQHRSKESLVREAKLLTQLEGFKGYIHDLGGPTANFYEPSCQAQLKRGTCRGKECLAPKPCKHLEASHAAYLDILRTIRALPKVKKVFIRSGIRFDYLLAAHDDFLQELVKYHVSGQLKIAPEHIADRVTRLMGKPGKAMYLRFAEDFAKMNRILGKKQYLVPYFMSSHPGCRLEDAIELAEFLHAHGYHPEQVQDFIPTPGTMSTAMYYAGIHPLTKEPVYVAKRPLEKKMQRALMQYWLPENRALVLRALREAGREDLIGYDRHCLIHPSHRAHSPQAKKSPRRH